MRDIDPTASEYISSGYLEHSKPGGRFFDIGAAIGLGGALIGADAAGDAADAQAASAAAATAAQQKMFDKQVALQEPFRQGGLQANNRLMYLLGLNPGATTGAGSMTYEQARNQLLPQFTKVTQPKAVGVFDPYNNIEPVQPPPVNTIDNKGLEAAIQRMLAPAQGQQTNTNDPAFGSLMRRFSMDDFEADPGYEFRREEGMRGVEGGAAARGGLLSGAALKAIQKYGQGLASQEYGNAYNRFTADQTNQYNRLAGVVNTGQGATNQVSNAAGNFGNSMANNLIGAGNAQAAGQIGQANAIVGGINGAYNTYQNNKLMDMIRKLGGSTNMDWEGIY